MTEPTKEKPPHPVEDENDDDLDDLLDEFDEQLLPKPPASESDGNTTATKNASTNPVGDEFTQNIEDLIKDLNIEDPEAKVQFEQLVKQFEDTHKEDAKKIQDPQNFDSVMKDTMERLKKSGETIDEQLKNDPAGGNPEDMLAQLMAGLGGAGGEGGDFDMSKLLADMLEQLSSKEVLYEPIKDLNDKFPDYLKENKGKIPDDEHVKYTKQYEITNQILAVFDASDYDSESPEKSDEVNRLLESLQELGNPPKELVGDDNDFPGFGGMGGAGGLGGLGEGDGLDFDSKDLPPDFEKQLEEGCKQT
ncbi:CIC11C00000003327 [Sungouiella intermedia]|uniref:CIC11C00000003327 n=1 Tax=Sungouiella intermedia TaxID=45354 RepID=A0A1L0BT22_9ASCO|nr:CIC11C00000003327 [[Candida] intermedia]